MTTLRHPDSFVNRHIGPDDPSVAEEASYALVKVATAKDQKDTSKDLRRKALQTALDKSKNDATRKKAQEGLKQLM